MPKPDKKQRRQAKRDAKRRESKRLKAIPPIKRLADAPGEPECWMSEDFESFGQRQIFAFKQAGGQSCMACFLVDLGVVGLKDCWHHIGTSRSDFELTLLKCRDQGFEMRRGTAEEVRNLVGGGLRWAYENGMRLPRNWTKTAALLGGIPNWQSADVSFFRKEFAGHPEDLRQRLIGEPLETYLKRDDIKFIFSEDAPYMDQQTGRYSDWNDEQDFDDDDDLDGEDDVNPSELMIETIKRFSEQSEVSAQVLATQTRQWLVAKNQTPSEDLHTVWQTLVVAFIGTQLVDSENCREIFAERIPDFIEDYRSKIPLQNLEQYDLAGEQVMTYLDENPNPVPEAVAQIKPRRPFPIIEQDEN